MIPYIRSALFIPANNPGMIQSSNLLGADAIIYDLEDAVSINQKDSARVLLQEAFNFFNDIETIKIVRVNPMDSPYFKQDVMMVKAYDIQYVLLAKATEQSIIELARLLENTGIKIIALIESAYAVYDLSNIIKASNLVEGVLFGAEDYALDMQIKRTKQSDEILVARQMIATTCRALQVFALDTPFTDVEDTQGLIEDTHKAQNYGFSGKACISPKQVKYVNSTFSPTIADISYAIEVIEAAKEAQANGLGVFSLNGKMVDAPIINRARLTLENAKKAGVKYE